MTSAPDSPVSRPKAADGPVDGARPFGAHLSMRWWAPLLLTVVVIVGTYLFQFLLLRGAAIVEIRVLGKDPTDSSLTPLIFLATNVAIILMGLLVLLVLDRVARVPWRAALSAGRSFRWRRMGMYLALFAGLMVISNAVIQVVHPSPLSLFAVSGTTVVLLVSVVLTTPLQAAAEEIALRGVLTASYASWIRSVTPALIVGITGSSVLFAALHTSTDPWMIANYLGLGASTAIMALLSRGLEASIAFHAMNNVFAHGIGALFAEGGGIGQDRSAGSAGPYVLIFIAVEFVAVILVWRFERRRRAKQAREGEEVASQS
ncbi:MAG: CPBP family intramembrane glutamic endopeptidase [Microbacterium sp.]